jgi:hypothetical protein
VYLDADLLITASVLEVLAAVGGQVLLTPDYYPQDHEHFISVHGYYNSGFVCARTRRFHEWWKEAFITQPDRWTDQAILNDAGAAFAIGELPESANIGFWRSQDPLQPAPIPNDCIFLHVHLLQPIGTTRQWIDRAFALHCVEFLQRSDVPQHRTLFREIMARDVAGWYKASLQIRCDD